MLESLQIRNFKTFHSEQDIKLSPTTLLSGQNSSGKSTIIQVLLLIKQTLESPVLDEPIILNGLYVSLGEFNDILNANADPSDTFDFTIKLKSPTLEPDPNSDRFGFYYRPWFGEKLKDIKLAMSFAKPSNDEEDNSSNFIRLEKSVVSGSLDDGTFELSVKKNNQLITKLSQDFDLDDKNYLHINNLYEVEECSGFNFKPKAVLLNGFLPEAIYKPYHKHLVEKQDEILEDFFNMICETFDLKKIGIDNQAINMKWERSILTVLKRLQIKKIKDNGSIDGSLADEMLTYLDRIFVERTELRDIEIRKNLTTIILKFNLGQFNSIRDFLIKSIEVIDRIKKQSKQALEINHVSELYFKNSRIDFDDICTITKKSFKSLYYLGPLRDEPKAFYRRMGSSDPMYVGQKGENVAFVLKYYSSKTILTVLPPVDSGNWNPLDSEIQRVTLGQAVEQWLRYIGVANSIRVEEMGKVGLTIRAKIHGDQESDLTNVGVGVSQILPLIVLGLSAPKDAIILLEQPELHLHPYVQSRLADFFFALNRVGKQIIAETHSEHLIHRLRLHIAKKHLKYNKDATIYFSERGQSVPYSQIKKIEVDDFGSIDNWPSGFFDETNKQLDDLLLAVLEREDIY